MVISLIPHFFTKEPIPAIINSDLQVAVAAVQQETNQKDALIRAYTIVTRKYRGYRFRTYLFFWKAWENDPNKLWERSGFLHCHQQDFLLRVLLVKSGWFCDDDISFGYSFVYFKSPHQYLNIALKNGTIIAADPWNNSRGAKLGEYATGFGFSKLK